jgi:predicted PhzF superfamily epimerase YddE/YHI9
VTVVALATDISDAAPIQIVSTGLPFAIVPPSWLVRYGLQKSAETLHIEQGVEMQRPSHIYVRAEKYGDKITNVCVGGHAVEVAQGEYAL